MSNKPVFKTTGVVNALSGIAIGLGIFFVLIGIFAQAGVIIWMGVTLFLCGLCMWFGASIQRASNQRISDDAYPPRNCSRISSN